MRDGGRRRLTHRGETGVEIGLGGPHTAKLHEGAALADCDELFLEPAVDEPGRGGVLGLGELHQLVHDLLVNGDKEPSFLDVHVETGFRPLLPMLTQVVAVEILSKFLGGAKPGPTMGFTFCHTAFSLYRPCHGR